MPDEIFSRLKIVDCGSYVAGPAAATVLADFGATVVKIEPLTGDPLRMLAPVYPSYFWRMDARSKKGLAIDLKRPEGREALERLVRDCDIFLTNFRTSLIDRLDLSYETLKALNPTLIYAHVTGYGERGDESERTAFDATAWWGRSGLQDWVRADENLPAGNSPGMGDHATAMSLFGAIMAALYRRSETGLGSKVHTSLLANGAWSHSMSIQAAAAGAKWALHHPQRRQGAVHLNKVYTTADDRFLMLNVLNHEKEFGPLLASLGLTELQQDPRFCDVRTAFSNMADFVPYIDSAIRALSLAEVRARFDDHGITYGHVQRTVEALTDPQMRANDVLVDVADPQEEWEQTVASPIWIDGVDKVPPRCAPEIGEHNAEVLASVGYTEDEIEAMAEAGVIGSHVGPLR